LPASPRLTAAGIGHSEPLEVLPELPDVPLEVPREVPLDVLPDELLEAPPDVLPVDPEVPLEPLLVELEVPPEVLVDVPATEPLEVLLELPPEVLSAAPLDELLDDPLAVLDSPEVPLDVLLVVPLEELDLPEAPLEVVPELPVEPLFELPVVAADVLPVVPPSWDVCACPHIASSDMARSNAPVSSVFMAIDPDVREPFFAGLINRVGTAQRPPGTFGRIRRKSRRVLSDPSRAMYELCYARVDARGILDESSRDFLIVLRHA
jgi:hypothetical protein